MFRSILLSISGVLLSLTASALEFSLNRALIGQDHPIEVGLRFNKADSGDLYVAVLVGNRLFFYGEDGFFSERPIPRQRNAHYSGEIGLFSFPAGVVPPFPYFLYAVVTDPGADVFDLSRWHGGVGGLARALVQVGGPFYGQGDSDHDGFYDDDFNRDGFHDDDFNYDGWRDRGDSTRGQALYAQYCASCHDKSSRRGKDAKDIAEAIAKNKGGMGFLGSILTPADLIDIAAYLAR